MFDQNSIDSFSNALRTIGFVVEVKQNVINGVTYTHQARWLPAPVNDGIYFKYTESQYTPLYTYTYYAPSEGGTISGRTYDESYMAEKRELYPDSFEILDTEDHTSSSFITYRLAKDNRDFEDYILEWTNYPIGYIVGNQGDNNDATRYRMRYPTKMVIPSGYGTYSALTYKIPYVKTSKGGVIILSLDYCEAPSATPVANYYRTIAYLPQENGNDLWTTAFFIPWGNGGARTVYVSYYQGNTIWHADRFTGKFKNGTDESLKILAPITPSNIDVTHELPPAQGHFYNGNTFINKHYKLDSKIFYMRYGQTVKYSMGGLYKDKDNNEFYVFNPGPYAIKI